MNENVLILGFVIFAIVMHFYVKKKRNEIEKIQDLKLKAKFRSKVKNEIIIIGLLLMSFFIIVSIIVEKWM